MESRNAITLGLGVAIALVISAGVAYGMMGRTAPQQGTYISTVTAEAGRGGGMMGGYGGSIYPGGMMGGYGGMMTGARGIMSGYAGMMDQFSQFMSGYMSSTHNGTATGAVVGIVNYGFYPANLTVADGTTVTWVNMDFVQHTVTSGTERAPTNLFDSHELNHMQAFSYTFSTPGTYTYYCDVHPYMTATVTVTA